MTATPSLRPLLIIYGKPIILHILRASVVVLCICSSSAGMLRAQSEPTKDTKLTAEYFHGDWCQRFTPPEEEGFPPPEEEVLNMTFHPDGAYLIGRVGSPLKEFGKWSFVDGKLRMPGNPASYTTTPIRVSDNEFRFKRMGIEIRIFRGHAKEE